MEYGPLVPSPTHARTSRARVFDLSRMRWDRAATENTGWTSYMKSSRSRSRNKNRSNTRPTGGNIVNRVFDSSGPEGKVRGTPQQIVEKYTQLHRDSLLARDSVNSENFAQHAEHYTRLLAEAQKEIDAKRDEQEKHNRERQIEQDKQNRERQAERDRERDARLKAQEEAAAAAPAPTPIPAPLPTPAPASFEQPEQIDDGDSGLVETPEEAPTKKRRTRKPKTRPDLPPEGGPASEAAE
jgi:hypothetical protein